MEARQVLKEILLATLENSYDASQEIHGRTADKILSLLEKSAFEKGLGTSGTLDKVFVSEMVYRSIEPMDYRIVDDSENWVLREDGSVCKSVVVESCAAFDSQGLIESEVCVSYSCAGGIKVSFVSVNEPVAVIGVADATLLDNIGRFVNRG